ncbi:arsenate reductase (glutaredoxin) [Marivirga tractuosa]|uniref:Arsenate reductase n=1 Tax=Marivirga tractuosa (strain ATCC 23168 / DSM 4126 / NBRC 15989 / NCIMB 1408 / VKM B-1430 / H-43) TaxID=643867 RepID=E4TT02_MARTH|nr:arsenate reductase (glutaredoxin) [Marivirga tractuosa]ADR20850.1 arsenate reductase [Marivirga tractuosa DSM 4126]BDD14699.1 arsenate reductase (glutaredoxin) [Marivirga tractuosa]
MKLYHNPRCGKSREALKLLQEKGIEPEIVEYLKNIPTHAELEDLLQKLDMKAEDLLRKNEKVFKELYKGKDLSDSKWIEAMIAEPKMIERPIFINGDKAVVGRPPEKVLDLI